MIDLFPRYVLPRAIANGIAALVITALLPLTAARAGAETLTLLALGDSLTQGYGLPEGDGLVPQLQAWLTAEGEDVEVINAGVSGDTTAGGLSRLDWSLSPEVDAVMVTLGGNDLLRGIDPAASRSNLDAILAGIKARGLPVLLVPMEATSNFGPDYKAAFDAMYPDLAAQHGALMADPFFRALASDPAAMGGLMQADGIHPNRDGVAKVVAALGPKVRDLLAEAQK